MAKKKRTNTRSDTGASDRILRIQIIVALITLAGVLATAMSSYFTESWKVNRTIEATQTAEARNTLAPLAPLPQLAYPPDLQTSTQPVPTAVQNTTWESEPNDSYLVADGPLLFAVDFFAFPNDARDFFAFHLNFESRVHVSIAGMTATGGQLQLFKSHANNTDVPIAYDVEGSDQFDISTNTLQAGDYFVFFYVAGGYNNSVPYRLRVETMPSASDPTDRAYTPVVNGYPSYP